MRSSLFLSCVVLGISPLLVRAVPLTQGVYVWQREQNDDVREAIALAAPSVDSYDVLALDVPRPGSGESIAWVTPAARALAATGKPIGLVMRVGPPPAGGRQDTDALVALAVEVAHFRARYGFQVSELQIDFDCAESGLSDYAVWLGRIRAAVLPVPVIFTALPSWLRHKEEFAALTRAADGFVLQVHSLDRPKGPDEPFTLCDPVKAREWVKQASAFGQPFRVALPTYGYVIAFDDQGRFIGLSADGERVDWPGTKTVRRVEVDPDSLATLVADWTKAPPAHCTGLLWFRLPVERDRLTWAQPTWQAVMAGRVPRSDLQVSAQGSESGLVEITLHNQGERFESPAAVTVKWAEKTDPIGIDAFGGFKLVLRGSRNELQIVAENPAGDERIAPGKSRTIAWIRFSHEVSVVARVAPQR